MITNEWPAAIARAPATASAVSSSSFPDLRTSRSPDASQNAIPNLSAGLTPASASCRSSTVLMKCAWPTMTLTSSGLPSATSSTLSGTPATGPRSVATALADPHVPRRGRRTGGPMSRTGVDSLDRSIDKTNYLAADVAAASAPKTDRMAYRVTRSWCTRAGRCRTGRRALAASCLICCAACSTRAGTRARCR